MNARPIGPAAHGAIDYGFAALNALAPTLFGLRGRARTICYAFAAAQGALNVLTDHPLALRRRVPLRVHGEIDTPYVPSILLLPWAAGALRERNARRYFASFFTLALANHLLTDYRHYERRESVPGALHSTPDSAPTGLQEERARIERYVESVPG